MIKAYEAYSLCIQATRQTSTLQVNILWRRMVALDGCGACPSPACRSQFRDNMSSAESTAMTAFIQSLIGLQVGAIVIAQATTLLVAPCVRVPCRCSHPRTAVADRALTCILGLNKEQWLRFNSSPLHLLWCDLLISPTYQR